MYIYIKKQEYFQIESDVNNEQHSWESNDYLRSDWRSGYVNFSDEKRVNPTPSKSKITNNIFFVRKD